MAVDKLVDSTKLDACLDAEADAIRAKTGGSANIPFDFANNKGFADAIAAIPSGGGYTANDLANMANPTGEAQFTVSQIPTSAFYHRTGITKVSGENVTSIQTSAFDTCTGLTEVFCPNAALSANVFAYCSSLEIAVIGSTNIYEATTFRNCTVLHTVDFNNSNTGFSNNTFAFCSALNKLIIRGASIPTLINVTCFNGTPFASGGSGGTIYIPKALYDHLGDGTALDYKAATNWSTIDGYGTITWAQIEGSIYETQYANGTTIPTT